MFSFFHEDLLGFGVVEEEFKGHMPSSSILPFFTDATPLSLVRLRSLPPLSYTVRECDFNTILIRNHGTVEENNVPETKPFHLILFLRNGSMVRMRQLFQSTKYEMPAFFLTSPL